MWHSSRYVLPLVLSLVTASFTRVSAQAGFQSDDHHDRGPHYPQYVITDLGTLGGPFSNAFGINDRRQVGGSSVDANGDLRAYLWTRGRGLLPLGTLLGGMNSGASGPNNHDLVPIISDTAITDPYNENFCGFGTSFLCFGGVWRDGSVSLLPPLIPLSNPGGNNTQNTESNDRGEIAGFAENGVRDATCTSATPGLQFDFEAVLWDNQDRIHKLRPLKGDTVGFALSINNAGQVVGGSGLCSNSPLFPLALAPHAVLWDREGNPTEIPGLGGTTIRTATSINAFGEVLGFSSLPGDQTQHAYLWTRQMRRPIDLGTLPGDESSIPSALGSLNDRSEAVGASCVSSDPLASLAGGNCRAFLWRDGQMLDLNSLIVPNGNPSQLRLLLGFGINNRGDVSGWAITPSGEQHAFIASKSPEF